MDCFAGPLGRPRLLQGNVYERIAWNLKVVFVLAGVPLSIILLLPGLFALIFPCRLLSVIFPEDSLRSMDWGGSNGQIIFPQAEQQAPFSKVVLADEDLFSLDKNECEVASELLEEVFYLFPGALAGEEVPVHPLRVVAGRVNGLQVSSVPNLAVE